MFTIIVAGLAAGLAAIPPTDDLVHHVEISRGDTPMRVSYRAAVDVERRQVGMTPPTRMGSARCAWQADVRVERRIAGTETAAHPSLGRTIDAGPPLTGSRPGDCLTTRRGVDKDIAGRMPEVKAMLAAVAQRDAPQLLADLDGAGIAGSGRRAE